MQTPPTPAATAAEPPIREFSRVAVADQLLRVGFFYDLNPDCTLIGVPTVRIVEPPKSGRAAIEKATGFPRSPPAIPVQVQRRARRRRGAHLHAQFRHTGSDSIVVEVIFPDGTASKRHYTIDVK